jgi:hypothetical protein
MSASSGPVLVVSALISSPILWLVHEGSISAEVAVQRWAICVALCWAAISIVSALAYPSVPPEAPATDAAPQAPAESAAE